MKIHDPVGLAAAARMRMKFEPLLLTKSMRVAAEEAIRYRANVKQWELHALNVRTNHIHVVLTAENDAPEQVMLSLKGAATWRFVQNGFVGEDRTVWTRHGSTKYLKNLEDMSEAIDYVLFRQGEPLT